MSETIAFIGLGLIGGSIARSIRRVRPETKILAYGNQPKALLQAQEDGIVDHILTGIDKTLSECDFIFLCTPVSFNAHYLALIKPYLKERCILTDVGSTKAAIHEEVIQLGLEDYFIGGHPMTGSERMGYENSNAHLLENSYYVISPTAKSKPENVQRLTKLAADIGALPLQLNYREHDYVVAAISHLPHLIASGLVNLVRDSDSDEGTMKMVAAGGFRDITRIASSSPEMWQQICLTNGDNIAAILKDYIASMKQILADIENKDADGLYRLFDDSKEYRDSISDRSFGPLKKEYSIYLDIVDEPGAISTIAVILSAKGVSIRNIGIIHNREFEEGVLKIVFYEESACNEAWVLLKRHNYTLYKR